MENNLNNNSQVFQNLNLSDLWGNLSHYGALQIFGAVFTIALILSFALIFLLIITGNGDKIVKLIKRQQAKKENDRGFSPERAIKVYPCPEQLSYDKEDAKEFEKMLLRKIDNMRQDNYSGKIYVVDMRKIKHMSEPIRDVFKKIAEGSVKLNVVWLIYVIPKIKKSKNMNTTEKYLLELVALCKKLNKPGSWSIKENMDKLLN